MACPRVGLTTAKYRVTVADPLAKGSGLSGVPKGGSYHSQVQRDRG